MKKIIYILSAALVLAVSCTREQAIETAPAKVVKTFGVTSEETKTSLGTDGKTVLWSSTDKIGVIAAKADGTVKQHEFSLKSGQNTKSAVFEGEVEADDVTFYAIYPNYAIDATNSSGTFADGYLAMSSGAITQQQSADAGDFDATHAVMTAPLVNDAFTFRHAAAYFKFKVGCADVKKVTFTTNNGNIRFGARLVIKQDDGTIYSVEGAKKSGWLVPATGTTFTAGETYYMAFYPRSNKKIGDLRITYTNSSDTDVYVDVPSGAILTTATEEGHIYNIGTPPISFGPGISATAPSKLAYDATEGTFTFTVNNPTGATPSASVTEGASWLSLRTTDPITEESGTYTVHFVCTANNAAAATERSGEITVSYTGATSVPVTVTQGVSSGSSTTSHTYKFWVNVSGNTVTNTQTADGESGSYFTHSSDNYGKAFHSDFGLSSGITAAGETYLTGLKFNSGGYVTFTTSSTLKTSVSYYAVRRKEGDTAANIQIKASGADSALRTDGLSYGTITAIENQSLDKGTTYTISRGNTNKESALVLVVVTETE